MYQSIVDVLFGRETPPDIEQKIDDECMNCGGVCPIYYEKRYNGYMSKCINCNTQWRES